MRNVCMIVYSTCATKIYEKRKSLSSSVCYRQLATRAFYSHRISATTKYSYKYQPKYVGDSSFFVMAWTHKSHVTNARASPKIIILLDALLTLLVASIHTYVEQKIWVCFTPLPSQGRRFQEFFLFIIIIAVIVDGGDLFYVFTF